MSISHPQELGQLNPAPFLGYLRQGTAPTQSRNLWGLEPVQTTVWNWVLVPKRFLPLAEANSPLCLDFQIHEMGSEGLAKLTFGKVLLGNIGRHPEAMTESALGLWTPTPNFRLPNLGRESATFWIL